MSSQRHEQQQKQQQQQQQQQQHHLGSSASVGAGVVTESVAFKLVCDMQHLRGKVDLMCSLGAGLAQRWVEEVVHPHHQLLHHKHRRAVESRLRGEMEELVLELVDVSVEIQRMKERKELAQRFFYLAERRRSWSQVYGEDDTDDEDEDEAFYTSTSSPSSKKGEAKAMLQLIDLDECDQVIDKLTTLLLGYLTAGEREEEERALRIKAAHLDGSGSAADALLRQPLISSSGSPTKAGVMRLHNREHDDNLLR